MKSRRPRYTSLHLLALFAIIFSFAAGVAPASAAPARSHTPDPTSVTIAGSLQSELGCAGDWDPACAATHLTYDAGDDVWQGTWTVPAGSYEYKAALNDGWDENYGLHADARRREYPAEPRRRRHASSSTTTTRATGSPTTSNSVIATVPGSFQSELGCPGDWDPGCLRSWLQDPDGDGIYSFRDDRAPGGQLRRQGRHQRELGRELRPGRRAERPEHPVHRAGRQRLERHLLATTLPPTS